jgi:hypothetical protein
MDQHGRSWTVILHPEKLKVDSSILSPDHQFDQPRLANGARRAGRNSPGQSSP